MNQIIVNISQQKLILADFNGQALDDYPVSTSKYGAGSENGSFKTPLGKHIIVQKIGDICDIDDVFVGRKAIGKLVNLRAENYPLPDDVIMSRILRLRGLELGLNQGENLDSYQRYIYIHGTSEENKIGTPASHGCVRMRKKDMIELFNRVDEGSSVNIVE